MIEKNIYKKFAIVIIFAFIIGFIVALTIWIGNRYSENVIKAVDGIAIPLTVTLSGIFLKYFFEDDKRIEGLLKDMKEQSDMEIENGDNFYDAIVSKATQSVELCFNTGVHVFHNLTSSVNGEKNLLIENREKLKNFTVKIILANPESIIFSDKAPEEIKNYYHSMSADADPDFPGKIQKSIDDTNKTYIKSKGRIKKILHWN